MAKRSDNAIAEERQEKREQELIEDGWLTARVSMKRRWSTGKDLFGLFDILAFKGERILLSQDTSHGTKGYIEQIEDWLRENSDLLPEKLECEVAIWKPASKTMPERFNIHAIRR